MGFLKDFKAFALKGNVMDMAVGVVIGAAFKEIINALVNNIITPFIVLLTGQNSLEALKWVLKPEIIDAAGEVVDPGVAVEYGIFLQAIVDFIIIAFCIFVVLRIMMNAQKKFDELRHKKGAKKPYFMRFLQTFPKIFASFFNSQVNIPETNKQVSIL